LKHSSVPGLFYLFFFLITVISLSGCGNSDETGLPPHIKKIDHLNILSGEVDQPYIFHFERELVFDDSLLLDEINTIALDDGSNLYIAGERWGKRQVHIFHPDGSYSDSLGRYGNDVGEFRSINHIRILGSELYLFDKKLKRVTLYDRNEGAWRDTIGFDHHSLNFPDDLNPDQFQAEPYDVFDDGTYMVAFRQKRNPAYEPDGRILYYKIEPGADTGPVKYLELPDIRYLVGDYAGRPAPFTLSVPEQPLTASSGGSKFYFAHTNEFLIRVLDVNGEHLGAYYSPYNRRLFEPEEVIHPRFSHNDQLLRIRESAEYPEKWPALFSMITDDENRIWISTITDNRDQLEWWVICEETGELLTRFTRPFNRPVFLVQNGAAYTVEKNSMGFKKVVKYNIEITKANHSAEWTRAENR
jgi:hypothetical protein